MGIFGKEAPVRPAELDGGCPSCSAPEASVLCQLFEWKFNGIAVIAIPTGYRFCCQRCGQVYSTNRHGSYLHHEQSLPWTPSPKLMDTVTQLGKQNNDSRPAGPPPRPPQAANDPLPFRHPKQR